MVTGRRTLVIGAHSADFVWRAGGAIAVTTAAGGTARVIALSYGERASPASSGRRTPIAASRTSNGSGTARLSAPLPISVPTLSRWTSVTTHLISIRKR